VYTTLKSFGKKFTLKDESLQAKEFLVEIGGKDRRCILYYSAEKAERDRKSREIRLARVREGLGEIPASLTRKGAGRKSTKNGVEGRIAISLRLRGKLHTVRCDVWVARNRVCETVSVVM
jgi:hypothetical protein